MKVLAWYIVPNGKTKNKTYVQTPVPYQYHGVCKTYEETHERHQ
jgi:hypothetical protein